MKKNFLFLMIKLFVLIVVYTLFIIPQHIFCQSNNSLKLNNSNFLEHGDFVYLNSPNYNFADKLTVACWFKWTADPQSVLLTNHESEGRYANIVTLDRHNALNMGQFWLQHSRDNSKYQFAVRNSSQRYVVETSDISNSTDDGVWHFLVGVYDGGSSNPLKIYLNGVLDESTDDISGNINPYNTNDRLSIGRVPSGYRMFTGEIDEVRIWKGALTQTEIRQQMFSKETINSSELASYFNMDQTSGTLVDDSGPQNADGTFYSALVDVHSITTSPTYTVSDNDKAWQNNFWANKPIKTIAGAGVDENNIVTSNSSVVLTLENPWVTTPILDGLANMTWYGIEDTDEISQWVESTAPVSNNFAYINTTTPTSVGPAGGNITVTITSTPSSSNNLGVYQKGSLTGLPITDETFPPTIDKRVNFIYGVHEWGSVTSTLQFSYSSVSGVNDASQLILMRRLRDRGTWENANATNDVNSKIFTLTGVTSYYEYTIGSGSTNPLPVELVCFEAEYLQNQHSVNLKWNTQTEVNNYGFEIERSLIKDVRSETWEKIGFVNGSGNSNSPKNYLFNDRNLNTGKIVYRLKQIDNDGLFSYSNVVEINIDLPRTFSLKQNYPNPFNPSTRIQYQISGISHITLKVYDILGNEIATLVNEEKSPGNYEVEFNPARHSREGGNLTSGIYFYQLKAGNFLETKKMILLK